MIPSIKFTGPDGMEWIIYGLTPYYADRFMAMIHAYQRAYEEQCARASTSISPPIPTSGDHLADAHTTTPNTTT